MMETVSPQDDSSGANPSSVKSDDSSPQQERGGGSPPPNCAICLGTCRNKSFTDSCLHQFCFKCLLTWSKVKAECPLCKQNFKSIIHNVRSNHQYEEYMVEQRHTEETTERIDIDSLIETAPRFRYRTTLTLTRRETMAIQQLLPHYPMMADVFLPPAPRAPQTRRRSSTSFRRTIYRHNLWARPLPDFTGRFRDCSPEFYRYNDPQMHRLVPWLNRELSYLLNENVGHISYVIARILELLPRYAINSPEFREAMQRYFGNRTEHFLHELYCFASTPYDMAGYDRNVQYTTDSRISTMVNEIISSSESDASVDSDIVMVSSSEPAEPPPGPSRRPPAPVYPQNYISQPSTAENVIPIETISHSDTDDDSSEVMVVGYIKPPQHRTPEIVDLLGSDSDVIVQDNAQPETSQSVSANASAEPQESRHVPLVKLSLKHLPKREREPERSDSEDSTYRPPAPGPTRPRKRRRRSAASAASAASASTSATRRSTPSPRGAEPARSGSPSSRSPYSPPSSSSSLASPSSPSFSSYTTCRSSTTSTVDDEPTSPSLSPPPSPSTSSDGFDHRRRRHERRKAKKKTSRHTRDRKRSTKSTRSHCKIEKDTLSELEKNRRSNRKSYSGKGVKSSKKKGSGDTVDLALNRQQALLDQPSTSGTSRSSRRSGRKRERSRSSHSTRENKRLRSVVNVMNSQKNSNDAISKGNPNLLNILSDAILNPNSNVLAYNSDSGSVPYDDRTRRVNDVPPEILEKAESCFNMELLTAKHVSDQSDSDDNLPLNLTVQKRT